MKQFDRYDHNQLKPSKAHAALHRLHKYFADSFDLKYTPDQQKEQAYTVLLMAGVEMYQALKKFLVETPHCHLCDGYGWIMKPDYNADGSDEYFDCDCGQDRLGDIAKQPNIAATLQAMDNAQNECNANARPLTDREKAYIEMHTALTAAVNSAAWDSMDTVMQDTIERARKAGGKWI